MPFSNQFGLMVIFESLEPPKAALDFLRSLNGVEVSGVWFVPNGAPPSLLLGELRKRLLDAERNAGVAVIRVWRNESHARIQGFPFLADWFQPEDERRQ